MTPFMRLREQLRSFVKLHEIAFVRGWHGIYMLVGLYVIGVAFPYATVLDAPWIIALLSLIGIFMPLSAEALVLFAFLLIHLFALSGEICGVTVGMVAISYLFCGVYHSERVHIMPEMIVARQFYLSCVIPLKEGLLGTARGVVAVFCGSVMSFFLQEVHANSGVLVAGDGRMPVEDFLRERIIANQMFYVYILAMTAMFLVVYVFRTQNISHAWVVAVLAGVSTEFLIMLSGYLLIGSGHSVVMLIVANAIAIVFGLIITYFYQDLDYSRIEKVQFEDDEYYYYVTAVPKIRLTEEKKEVRHIHKVNRSGRERGK